MLVIMENPLENFIILEKNEQVTVLNELADQQAAIQMWHKGTLRSLLIKALEMKDGDTRLILEGAHQINETKTICCLHAQTGAGHFYSKAFVSECQILNQLTFRIDHFFRLHPVGENIDVYPQEELYFCLPLSTMIPSNVSFLNKNVKYEGQIFKKFLKLIRSNIIPERDHENWKNFRIHRLGLARLNFVCNQLEKDYLEQQGEFRHGYLICGNKQIKLAVVKILSAEEYKDPRLEAVSLTKVTVSYAPNPTFMKWPEISNLFLYPLKFTVEKEKEIFHQFELFLQQGKA
jgi:hypothetical protein